MHIIQIDHRSFGSTDMIITNPLVIQVSVELPIDSEEADEENKKGAREGLVLNVFSRGSANIHRRKHALMPVLMHANAGTQLEALL